MSRRFIAAVLSTALALTSFGATSARAADADDLVKLLAGAATIYVIANAAEQARERKDGKVSKKQKELIYERAWPQYGKNTFQNRMRPPLPAECLWVPRNGSKKHDAVFSARCLNRKYDASNRLPRKCRTEVRTQRGYAHAYGAQCLRKRGYVMGRR